MTDREEQVGVNRQAGIQYSDEERVAEVAERDSWIAETDAKAEAMFAVMQQKKAEGYKFRLPAPELDRSMPIGRGPGMRQVTDWRDHQAAKMFQLDLGMGDQDEAYSPTVESTTAMRWSSEYMNHAIAQTQQLDPELASMLSYGTRYLALYPELAVTTRNGFGFAGITEELIADLLELDINAAQMKAVSEANLEQSDTLDRFLHEFGTQMDPATKQLMFYSMASLSPGEQKHMAAEAAAYIDNRPLKTNEDQLQFAGWFFAQAEDIYARENDQSFWGKFGRSVIGQAFQEPADFLQDEILQPIWNFASDPADAWYRSELTLEETMAISFGQDPGTAGYETFTGVAGAGLDIVVDPLNIAFAAVGGLKAAKTLAMIDEVANVASARRGLMARQLIPFAGGKKAAAAAGLPKGVRGRSARFMWAAVAKTQDGLVDTAKKNGVMKEILEADSYSDVVRKFPTLRKAPVEVVEYLLTRGTEAEVESAMRSLYKGEFLDSTSTAFKGLEDTVTAKKTQIKQTLNATEEITAGDVATVNGGGVFHNKPVVIDNPNPIKPMGEGVVNGLEDVDQPTLARIMDNPDVHGQEVSLRAKQYIDNPTMDPIGDDIDDALLRAIPQDDNLKYNEVIQQETLKEGKKLVQRGTIEDATDVQTHKLSDGREATIYSGVTDGGQKYSVAVVGDEVVSARIGQAAGTKKGKLAEGGFEREGLYTRILEIQRDKLGLTRKEVVDEATSISDAAAVPLSRVFNNGSVGSPVEDITAAGTSYYLRKNKSTKLVVANGGTKRHTEIVEWINANTKVRGAVNPDGTIKLSGLKAYMKAHGVDAIEINGRMIFRNQRQLISEGKLVAVKNGMPTQPQLGALASELRTAKTALKVNKAKSGEVAKWIISDMPLKVPSELENLKFWKAKFGVFAGTKYSEANALQRRFRGFVAKVFVDDIPPRIATGWQNRKQGVEDLRRLLVQMNVDPDFVARSIDEYLAAPTVDTVNGIIKQAASDIGDHELALGLMRFRQKDTDQLEYAIIGGDNLTMGADGRVKPLLPSQLSNSVQLPDTRTLSAHLRRIKKANKRKFNVLNRGFGKTKKGRQELIEGFSRRLGQMSREAQAEFNALDDHDKWAMAYAVVRPEGSGLGDGLGVAAQMGQVVARQWRGLRNAFSVMQLAWRPIGWVGNEFLDNAWRGAMAGTLSFFRHPFASMQGVQDARRIAAAQQDAATYLRHAEDVIRSASQGAQSADDVLRNAEQVIPSIRQYVSKQDDVSSQVTEIRKFLNNEAIYQQNQIDILSDPLAQALHKQRKGYNASKKYSLNQTDGLTPDPDWADVSRTGWEKQFAQTHASSSQRHAWTPGQYRDPETLRDYALAWHDRLNRDINDPFVSAWMEQFVRLAEGGEDNMWAARRMLNTPQWEGMKDSVRSVALHDGLEPDNMSDLELLSWYFNHKIDPYARDLFGELATPANMRSLRQGVGVIEYDGVVHALDLDDPDSTFKFIQGLNGTNAAMPETVVGVVNPRTLYGFKQPNGWKTPIRSYNDWALKKFGHDIPVNIQRRPAFLRTYNKFKQTYLNMGMTDEAAHIVAQQKGVEYINKSFFYLEAQTPFLKSMNNVLPFFAAQWEIIRAWTWKVPTLTNYAGVGHARMLRSFDHIFNTLQKNGLLEPRYANDGKVEGWDMRFAQDPMTDNILGSSVSRAGFLMLSAPSVFVEQIAEIATGMDLDLAPEEFNFNFNHPYDFFGKGGGVLPTARMQIGLHPAAAPLASAVRDRLPFTSQSRTVKAEAGTALQKVLDDNEVSDVRAFLALNEQNLIEDGVLSQGDVARLKAGTLTPQDVDLSADFELVVPNSSLMGDLIDNVLFAYGQTDSIAEISSSFVPQTLKQAFKALALYANNGDIDGMTAWMVPPILGPSGTYGLGVAYSDAAAVLEMRTGIFTRRNEVAQQLAQASEGERDALEAELHNLDDTITREVRDSATTQAFVNTLYSIALPTNPRTPSEREKLADYYWSGLNASREWNDGNPVHMPQAKDKTVKDVWGLVAAWASDPTGSNARLEFLEQGGGRTAILAAITPKSFWGPGGPPAVFDTLNGYFESVDSGDRKALPWEVRMQRYQRLVIQAEKELAIYGRYGPDIDEQVAGILSNKEEYDALIEDFDNKYRALDIEDELLHDGAYMKWVERNGTASYEDYVYAEQQEEIDAVNTAIKLVEQDMYPTDPGEASALVGQLKGISSGLYGSIERYNDERYAGFASSPRQERLNAYYEKLGDYYDELSDLYQLVADSESDYERDAAYTRIANFRATKGYDPIFVAGQQLPPVEEYTWNGKAKQEREVITLGKTANKIEWFTPQDIQRIITDYPDAAQYLPVSPEAQMLMESYKTTLTAISRAFSYGGEYDGKSPSDAYAAAEEQLVERLTELGEFGVIETIDAPPFLRQSAWGMLPERLEFITPYVVSIDRQLKGMDKSILTKKGTEAKRYMYDLLMPQFEQDPALREEFVRWGQLSFGETFPETIISKMLGDYRGNF